MNHKQMPRLGSAIASTILSVFSAVSLVGVDKAQAAVLRYSFDVGGGAYASGSFKVDNSSLTGIEVEEIAVSEGILHSDITLDFQYKKQPKEYYDLAGARAVFYQGAFRGLYALGGDEITPEDNIREDEGVPYYTDYSGGLYWSLYLVYPDMNGPHPLFSYVKQVIHGSCCIALSYDYYVPVTYTLVDTEPSPVPEPLTAGGTALALAGLSWLKHKKKMAA